MKSIRAYEDILQVSVDASENEIKRKYRRRAMELHPDRNTSPDAHDQFVLLQEAYDYFLNLKAGKINTTYTATSYQDWYEQRREEAHRRARVYAKMKYEEYLQSDDFKAVSAVTTIFDWIGFLLLIAFIVSVPVIATLRWGLTGCSISLILLLLTLPYSTRIIRQATPDFSELGVTLKFILKSSAFWTVFFPLLNSILLITIGFRTLISPFNLFLAFALPAATAYIITKWLLKIKNQFRIFFIWFCISPIIINSLLLTNYLFSRNPVKERYHFTVQMQETPQGKRITTTILLDQNKYDEYYFLRFFNDYQDLILNEYITYTISKGAFGINVMTAYRFD